MHALALLFTPIGGDNGLGGLLLGGGGNVLVFQDPRGGLLCPAAHNFFWGFFATFNGFQLILEGLEATFHC